MSCFKYTKVPIKVEKSKISQTEDWKYTAVPVTATRCCSKQQVNEKHETKQKVYRITKSIFD